MAISSKAMLEQPWPSKDSEATLRYMHETMENIYMRPKQGGEGTISSATDVCITRSH